MTNEEIKAGLRDGTIKPRVTDKGRFFLKRCDDLIAMGLPEQEAIDEAEHDANVLFGDPSKKPPQGIMGAEG